MPFSDSDLKRLKGFRPRDQDGVEIRPDVLRGLLSRLEAAEKVCRHAKNARSIIDELMGDSDLDGDDSPEFKICQRLSFALEAWRKAAGK